MMHWQARERRAYVVFLLDWNIYPGPSNLGGRREEKEGESCEKDVLFSAFKNGLKCLRMKHQVQPHAMLMPHLYFYIM